MIFNPRGPSGSGKSWVVRQVMRKYPIGREVYAGDQRTVEGVWLHSREPTFVVGSYAAPTGGADALRGGWEQISDIVVRASLIGHVLLEGIRINSGHTNLIELVHEHGLQLEVIFLDTGEEDCFQNVVNRREAVRNKRNLDNVRHWIRDHIRRNERQVSHFTRAGIPIQKLSAAEAVNYIVGRIGDPADRIGARR